MNRTARWSLLCLVSFLCMAGAQAQQRPVAAEPQAPSRTAQAPSEVVPPLAVPRLIKFAGTLKDAQGKPLSNTLGVTFAIYKEPEGGAALWLETQNVELDEQGRYSVLLGATKSEGLPLELFRAGEPRWLGVQVNLPRELEQPRVLLVSVPYALKAADADMLGGIPASAFVLAAPSGTASGTGMSGTTPGKTTASSRAETAAAAAPIASATDLTGQLTFIGIAPCRILDTRGFGWTGQAGPPSLIAGAQRTFQITGTVPGVPAQCGVPDTALAISVNFTVTGFAGAGDIRAFPAGGTVPQASILNYQLENIANATTVPLGPSGGGHNGITVQADAAGTDFLADVNGYYVPAAAGGITAVNTPAGSGLMGGATSGAVNLSLLGTCASGQVLQWTGTAWACATVSSAAGVTSVAAGTGITASPSPITSTGTISLNTAFTDGRYAQLGANNTFTGTQTINSGGTALTANGTAVGAFGTSPSPTGIGVSGTVSSTADNANDNGVQGVTASPIGIGVNGLATDTTGGTTTALGSIGVNGQSASPNGIGVVGFATDTTAVTPTSPNQGTTGVQGRSNSLAGIGVRALDLSQCLLPGCDPSVAGAPAPVGLFARVLHANGVAVFGVAGSGTVGCALPACDPTKTGNVGVLGRSFHPNGVGMYGIAADSSVTNTAGGVFSVGVVGQSRSPTSYALYANFIPATVDVGAAALFNNQAGLTAQPPSTLCTGQVTCTILELQANGTREFHFDGAGNAHAAGTFMGGGADFAESVSVRGERRLYDAGDVMVIDDAGNRSLAKAQKPYSTLVAGIVSTKPGVLASLHNSTTSAGQKAIEAEVPLAVVGIVPCKVSAENGPVHAGDLLVTSSTPGYAMKGTNRRRMLGAVVGKAMQPMESGKGVIEVLVTLQ